MNNRPYGLDVSEVPPSLSPNNTLSDDQRAAAAACWQAARILSVNMDEFAPEGILSLAVFILSGGEEMIDWVEVAKDA